jgi:hypothetical protein
MASKKDSICDCVTEKDRRLWKQDPGPRLKIKDLGEPCTQKELMRYFHEMYLDYRGKQFSAEVLGEFLGLMGEGRKRLPIISRTLRKYDIEPEFYEIDRVKFKLFLWRKRFRKKRKEKGYEIQPTQKDIDYFENLKRRLLDLRGSGVDRVCI